MEAAGIKENKCTGLYSLWAIQKPKSGIQILDGGGMVDSLGNSWIREQKAPNLLF